LPRRGPASGSRANQAGRNAVVRASLLAGARRPGDGQSADPCVDFYQYACGGWIKANPIPPDRASWNVYAKLAQDNQRFLWGILESLAKPAAPRNEVQQKIGDYFAACMDEAAIEKLGAAPLKPHLDRIVAMMSKQELPEVLARLHLIMDDGGLFFGFSSSQDYADSTQVIAFAVGGGLGLPDRDYYVKDDDKSKEIRAQYVAHVAKMFELTGDTPEAAARNADTVMAIETELAKARLTRTERRDPYKRFHKVDFNGLQALTPAFDWKQYLRAVGLGPLDTFNVTEPAFYEALERQWRERSLDDVKVYLRWHTAHAMARHLSRAFVEEDFKFFSKTLRGIEELRPRWKRCVAWVDEQLGEALGQEFVRRTFGPPLKTSTLKMTQQIEQAMAEDIKSLPWMSAATKERALAKLRAMVNKIGYPTGGAITARTK
jgi:endothelin-converting enzyme/putative endopeptidase